MRLSWPSSACEGLDSLRGCSGAAGWRRDAHRGSAGGLLPKAGCKAALGEAQRAPRSRCMGEPPPAQLLLLSQAAAPVLDGADGVGDGARHAEVISGLPHQPLGVALACGRWGRAQRKASAGLLLGGAECKAGPPAADQQQAPPAARARRGAGGQKPASSRGAGRHWAMGAGAGRARACGLVCARWQLPLLIMAAHQPGRRVDNSAQGSR